MQAITLINILLVTIHARVAAGLKLLVCEKSDGSQVIHHILFRPGAIDQRAAVIMGANLHTSYMTMHIHVKLIHTCII